MLSPPVRLLNNTPYVVGGANNTTLRQWLLQIGVPEFYHIQYEVIGIGPKDLEISAAYLKENLSNATLVFSVGIISDKLLTKAGLMHGALPRTSIKDKKKIMKAITECRNYFLGRV